MKKYTKNSDEPISGAKDDKFGRSEFALALAEALIKVPKQQSITVGLYGSWGSGKTSIINLAVEHFKSIYPDDVVVIKFNPWVFSSTETLHMAFFGTLASKLKKNLKSNGERISTQLKRYGELTGPVSDTVGLFFPSISVVSRLAGKSIGKVFKNYGKAHSEGTANIENIKNKVDKMLTDSGKRVVVIIDDIDRLDSDEIHQIFKLVKNVAHFKNVSYLLSFDHVVVAEALAERYPKNPSVGGSFIDKIIQIPLYVPTVDQELLNKYLTDELDKIINGRKMIIDDEDLIRFQSIYFSREGWRLFSTPRKVVRYLNTIDFSLEQLGNEASFSDISLIDMLRNFYTELYLNIANNKEVILRTGSYGDRNEASKEHARKQIFGNSEPSGLVITIVRELFPSFDWALGGSAYGDGFEAQWEESRRICTDKYFNRYFSYGIPPGDVKDSTLESFISSLGDTNYSESKAHNKLNQIVNGSSAKLVISKLRRKKDKLPEETSKRLAEILVTIGFEFGRSKEALAGDMLSPYIQSAILIVRLTKNINRPFELLKSFIKTAPVNYAAELLRWIRVNSENDENQKDFIALLSTEQVDELGKLLAEKIKINVKDTKIYEVYPNDIPHLMWIWHKWGNKADIKKYLEKMIKQDDGSAVDYLTSYVGNAYEMETGKQRRSEFRREAYNALADAVDPEIFVKPLYSQFGDEIKDIKEFPYTNFSKKEDDFRKVVAFQFIYLHNHVKNELTQPVKEIIEGEVVENSKT